MSTPNKKRRKLCPDPTASTTTVVPAPVAEALAHYRALRHAQTPSARASSYWKSGSPAVSSLRSVIEDKLGSDAAWREMLLLEAAGHGYLHLVRELLRPSSSSSEAGDGDREGPMPVSIHAVDADGNNVLHRAASTGNVVTLKWILKHIEEVYEDFFNNSSDLILSLNGQMETPFSLAVRRGNLRVLNLFLFHKRFSWHDFLSYFMFRRERWGIGSALEETSNMEDTVGALKQTVSELLKSETDQMKKTMSSNAIGSFSVLQARKSANAAFRDKLDIWLRQAHMESIQGMALDIKVENSMLTEADYDMLSLSKMQEMFGGQLNPWWDSSLSSFDLNRYVSSRTEKENGEFFMLLQATVGRGHHDTALWLLQHFKAPPSFLSYRRKVPKPDKYLRATPKIMEKVLFGWTDSRVRMLMGSEKRMIMQSEDLVNKMFGLAHDKGRQYSELDELQDLVLNYKPSTLEEAQADFSGFWNYAWHHFKDKGEESFYSYDVDPQSFVAIKLACLSSVDDFEASGQGKLLSHFLTSIYEEDANFLSADLPRLAHFVALDHLMLFQYLTKSRHDNVDTDEAMEHSERRFLDLGLPILCPITELLSSQGCGEQVDEGEDCGIQCAICLDPVRDPYNLKCGHSFCHKCLFWSIFPQLRNVDSDSAEANSLDAADRGRMAHQALAKCHHLSITLGKSNCPYCRQSIKPTLSRAFALNLADGLRRTSSERRLWPHSPHLDIVDCPAKTTVGEVLLVFAACCGAVNIFQWLVRDEGVKPEGVIIDGVNIMHNAMTHGKVIIVRWLCENGYSEMMYGGMHRDNFDSCNPFPEGDLPELRAKQIERISVWERKLHLAQLKQHRNAETDFSKSDQTILSQPLNEDEKRIMASRSRLRRLSPIHSLLMSTEYDRPDWKQLLIYLNQTKQNVQVLPLNWCHLVLSCGGEIELQMAATSFLSQDILSYPEDLDSNSLKDQVRISMTESKQKNYDSMTFFNVTDYPEPISLLEVAKDLRRFNFWRIFARGESDWRLFFQVALALDVWNFHSCNEVFEDKPNIHVDFVRFLSDVVVDGGCVEMLASFCTMQSFQGRADFERSVDSDLEICEFTGKVMLRKFIDERGKSSVFLPLFQQVDRNAKINLEASGTLSAITQAIASGKSLDEIKNELSRRRNLALTLPTADYPLGITRDGTNRYTDPSRWDWLDGRSSPFNRATKGFEQAVHRGDKEILHWIFSMIIEKAGREGEGSEYDEETTIREMSAAIIRAEELFGVKQLVIYFVEVRESSKYYGNKRRFVVDIIFGSMDEDDDKVGMLELAISKLIGIEEPSYELEGICKKYNGSGLDGIAASLDNMKAQVEKMYEIIKWLLDLDEAKSFIMGGSREYGKSVLLNRCLCECAVPHQTFRMLKLLFSYGLDPWLKTDDGESTNLIQHIIMMNQKAWRRNFVPPEITKVLAAGEEYKDRNGNTVQTACDVVRWLALDVGVGVQHLRYNDICFNPLAGCVDLFTENEWDELKECQKSSK